MRTENALTAVTCEPGLPRGLRGFSNALMKGLPAALALVILSFGTSAYAGDGPYVGVGGSLSILNTSDVTDGANEEKGYPPLNIDATTNNGFAVRGMAGYAFPSGLRVEAEIDYRRHGLGTMDVKSPGGLVETAAPIVAEGAGSAIYPDPTMTEYADLLDADKRQAATAVTRKWDVEGNFSMLAFMANVDYDFDMGSPWKPYIGGGLGVASISIDADSATSGRSLSDDSDTVFAYQVGAGLGYEFPLEEGRSITVSLDWRYFGTQAPTFTGDVSGEDFEATINGHDVGISFIYGF
ncbi:MAG: outer membrane beta-barrel protein [Nitrospira sp.]|nr:outer membrane beta-barrel protein [Nitrospira sp.]MDE0486015.1 outer membrane beta-barrel protein [Nitrospira sp.]